jgi:hypothetical protein
MDTFLGGPAFALLIAGQFLAVVAARATIAGPSVRDPGTRSAEKPSREERHRARGGLTVMSCAQQKCAAL